MWPLDHTPLLDVLPPAVTVRHRLGDALREVELLRRLLRLAERAEYYREHDRKLGHIEGRCRRAE